MSDIPGKRAIQFNEGQLEAIRLIKKWFSDYVLGRTDKQCFFLDGSAGTGKTSVARAAAAECVGGESMLYRVKFIAPTGKAASRLRQKGCQGAGTLHQFVYRVLGEDEEGDPQFMEKVKHDENPSLVVADEISMVSDYDFRTVKRRGIPILQLGDLKQVQPVNGTPCVKEGDADFTLTEIMRQVDEDGNPKPLSNITRGAMFISEGKSLPFREYDDVQVRPGTPPIDDLLAHVDENAQILCSYNGTRVGINNDIRKALGFEGPTPQVGEKVMCWFNQHGKNFMNGEQGIVLGYREPESDEVSEGDAPQMLLMTLRSLTDGRERTVKFNPLSFDPDPEVSKEALKAPGGFQFGYAATIHKSQGSEWDRVLVIEERMGNYAKLGYTAATRAAKNLRWYRP
jgi:exodeoxyribonuclease-5